MKNTEFNKEVGVIGLGRMGLPLGQRLRNRGYQVFGYDFSKKRCELSRQAELQVTNSVGELCRKIPKPRKLILLVPAGEIVDQVIQEVLNYLDAGDFLLDFGNSHYKDSARRSSDLMENSIQYLDVGMSGGMSGARNGACLTIGGSEKSYNNIEFLFRDIATENGYAYIGPSGWGHLVKTIHNGIEYGFLQAIAEGIHTINAVAEQQQCDIDLVKLCQVWNHGSIIESRLIQDCIQALQLVRDLSFAGSVGGGETGTWALGIAQAAGVSVPALEAALNFRKLSINNPDFTGKIIAAIRNTFGGHNLDG